MKRVWGALKITRTNLIMSSSVYSRQKGYLFLCHQHVFVILCPRHPMIYRSPLRVCKYAEHAIASHRHSHTGHACTQTFSLIRKFGGLDPGLPFQLIRLSIYHAKIDPRPDQTFFCFFIDLTFLKK